MCIKLINTLSKKYIHKNTGFSIFLRGLKLLVSKSAKNFSTGFNHGLKEYKKPVRGQHIGPKEF